VRWWGWRLPRGSLTLVFTLKASLMGVMRDQQGLIPVAVIAGLAVDELLRRLKPCVSRARALRLFAAGVPLLWSGVYVLALHLTHGVWWTMHVWAGTIGVAGLVGWLVSSLVVPPPGPTAEHGR
jgi:hypothetical protein